MPVIVQTVTSTVTALWGKSYIRDANGKFRPLQLDEVVVRGDMILTEQNAIVQLTEDLKADAAPAAHRVAHTRVPEASDLDRTIAALERGDAQAAPASGTAAADGGLTPATVVERVVEVAPGGLQPLELPAVQQSFSAAGTVAAAPTVSVAQAVTAQLNVQRVDGAEVTEGTAMVFPVQLSAAGTEAVTLPFSLTFNSAEGQDIGTPIFSEGVVLNADGTITVPAGVSGFVVTVPTVDDNTLESAETITLTLDGVSATGQINDNDQPAITGVEPGQPGANGDAVPEGAPLVYTVSLAQPSSTASLYPFSLGGGTGDGFAVPADHEAPVFSDGVVLNADGTITVPPGVTTFTVTVPTVDDSDVEPSERLPLTVAGVTGTGTITDNDGSGPTVDSIVPGLPGLPDATTLEGSPLSYNVTLSAPTTTATTFPFALGGGTAGVEDIGTPVFTDGVTLNADGTITVPAGVSTFNVTVPTSQDTAAEPDETLPLTIGGVTGTGTIIDDDAGTPTVTGVEPGAPGLGDDATPEGTVLTYTVSLSGTTVAATTYSFALGGGTATAGDFGEPVFTDGVVLNADGTITVPAGVNSFSVSVPTTQDTLIENNETLPLMVGDVTATGTIVDDDGGKPTVVTVEPGAPGLLDDATPEGTALVYTVTLSGATPAPATYPFTLGSGTAAADDFEAPVFSDSVTLNADGTITVPAGVSSFSVTVPTTQDTAVETDESLPLTIDGVTATGTIIDDDGGKPGVVGIEPGNPGLADDAAPEGADLVFTVTLSGATTAASTYPFQLGSGAAGTAGSADFGAPVFSDGVVLNADGTITVPAGVSRFSVSVPTTQDTEVEANEALPLTIGGVTATGTIIDDDGGRPVVVSVEPGAPGVADDSTPEGSELVYTVTLSDAAGTPTTHAFSLGGGTAAPEDLGTPTFSGGVVLNADGTITVPAGVTSFTVTVPTEQDTLAESEETVPLTVGGVGATGTIIDDDSGAPTVVGVEPGNPGAADDRVPEGTALAYTVSLSAPTTAPATYAFNLGGGTAVAEDVGLPVFSNGVTLNPDGSITVPAGVQSFTITVPTVQDSLIEGDETLPLTVGDKTATGTIADDDVTPTITTIEPGLPGPDGNSAPEGSDIVYTVSLSAPTNVTAFYPFKLGGGTAGAEDLGTPVFSDGVTLNPDGTITVPAGVASFTVTVPTTQDTLTEADETVPLSIGGVSASGTIVDDDGGKPTVTRVEPGEPGVADDATPEGSNLVYTVSLSGTTNTPSVYAFALGGGTAGAADIGTKVFSNGVTLNADGTITVPAGVASFTVTVPTTQDTLVEANETLPLEVGGMAAVGSIVDDDGGKPGITSIEPGAPGVADDATPEGSTLQYVVTLSAATNGPATYSFTLGGGTAGAGDIGQPQFTDGVTLNADGTITVPDGVSRFSVFVSALQDSLVEADETVPLTIGGTSATASIIDDDGGKPTVITVEPGAPGAGDNNTPEGSALVFTVTLSAATTDSTSYSFDWTGGTAGAADVGTPIFSNGVTLAADGTLNVPAGVSSFTITVPTVQDTLVEPDETVTLTVGGTMATGTIVDDDGTQPPITSIEPGQPGVGDDKVTEGGTLDYTVTLGSPTTAPAVYAFTLGGGTADAGDVGTPVFSNGVTLNPDGTITVPTGVSSFTVSVPSTQDAADEPDETLPLTIGGVTATATIIDDDAPPTVQSVTPNPGADQVTEGGTLGYTVTLSGASATATVFAFQIGGGTAQAGDFGAPVFSDGVTLLPIGGVLVPPGVTSFTVQVPTFQDQLIEPSETVPLSIGGVRAEGIILDDDSGGPGTPPGVVSVEPGNPGTSDDRTLEGSDLVYTVTLSGPTTEATKLSFELGGGTAGSDDLGTPSFSNGVTLNADGTLNVPAGVSSFQVVVPSTQDSIDEPDETVPLRVGGISGTGTLVDDDAPPTITGIEPGNPGAGDDTVLEGDSLVYTVSLSNASSTTAVFAFKLGGGTAGDADIGSPVFSNGVTLNPDGSISVPAGVTEFTVTVPTVDDTTSEANETLPLQIGGVSAVGTIVDNDTAPPTITGVEPGQFAADDDSVVEGANLMFSVKMSGPSATPTTFAFTLGGGTASAADIGTPVFSDGVVLNADGTITVPAGVSSFKAYVPTVQDSLGEPDETVPISIGGVSAVGGIIDDDGGTPGIKDVTAAPGSDRVTEGQDLVFNVSLTHGAAGPTTHLFSLAGGTAGAADLGTPVFSNGVVLNANGTITVPAGVTRFSVTVPTTQDTLQEADETVRLSVGGVVGTGTIVDDDFNQAPVVGHAAASVSEEGLAGGIKDSEGSPADTTDAKTASGRITISDPEGQTLSAPVLTAPTTALTSGGVPVTWSGSGTGTLTASAGGATVATVQIDADGNYSFTLLKPVDHPAGQGENLLKLDIGVQASDGRATGSGTLSISIEDDAPVAANQVSVMAAAPQAVNTNVMVVLDVSGSMGDPSGIPGQTRLQAAVSSLKTVLDRYDDLGDVAVRLVTFSSEGKALGDSWTTVAQAKTLLATLQTSGSTNYDDALADAIKAFDSPGRIAGGQNVAYFLSDGEPTAGSGTAGTLSGTLNNGSTTTTTTTPGTSSTGNCNFFGGGLFSLFKGGFCGTTCNTTKTTNEIDKGIQPSEEKIWTDFLTANGIDARAVGMGTTQATLAQLDPIAYNGVTQTNTGATAVAHFADLTAALAPRGEATASGNLFSGGLGADGGHVHSFSVDGVTYTYDPEANGNTGGVTASATGSSYRFDPDTQSLVVQTAAGGRFTVDLNDGNYTFSAPAGAAGGGNQNFAFALIDNDGDIALASGTIKLGPDNQAPVAVADQNSVTLDQGGAASPVYFVGADKSLGTVDPGTGARVTLGHTSQVFHDVAVTPGGDVYGVTGAGAVYAINPATCATTPKAVAPGMNALAADENGTLYGTTYAGQLYTINPGNGAVSAVAHFGCASSGDLVVTNGKVFMSSTDGKLLAMDLSTHSVSVAVGSLPGDLYSLSLRADGDLCAITAGGRVYTLDPVAHTAHATGVTMAGSALYGIGSSAVAAQAAGQVSGDVTPGTAGQDRDPDGDSFKVTGVVAGTATSAAGQVGQQISGTYGTLTLQADGSYTYTVDGSKPATQALGSGASAADVFSYTITDAKGATATTTLTLNVNGGDRPAPLSGQISGVEDQCITLKWEHFGSTQALTGAQSVSFTKMPADGELQVCVNGSWRDVAAGEKISKTAIDGGQLRFKPDANESGADGMGRDGVGNGKNTYAAMDYAVHQASGQLAAHGSLDVDIKPVADSAARLTCNLMSAHSTAIGAPAGHRDGETVLADGTVAAAGTPGGYFGFWHHVCLQSCTLTPDKDGSEKAFYQLKVNQLDVASSPTVVALNDGTILKPAADGSYWLAADQADKVWVFRQWGAGPNGNQYSHQSVTATSWNAELDASGNIVHKVQGNSITSCSNTPLVLDLDGNGIQTVDSKAGASFDYDGDGVREATGWVGGHDGLLVRDINGDGRITDGKELFGDAVQLADGSRAADGYAALRELDANHDSVIDAKDAGFAQLKVWVDANGDGLTQDGELLTLQQAGVQSMNLRAQHSDQFDNGNHIALTSDFTRTDGSVHAMADVWFGAQHEEAAPPAVAAPAVAAPAAAWGQEVFAWDLAAPAEPGAQILTVQAQASGLDLRDLLGGSPDGAADALQTFLASAPPPAAASAAAASAGPAQQASGAQPPDSHAAEVHAALSLGMGSSDDSALRDLLNRDKPDMGT